MSRNSALTALLLAGCACALPAHATSYVQTNLVTDNQAVAAAANTDTNLKNPWGISHVTTGNGSPFWVSDNDTGVSTLYNGAGAPSALVVAIGDKTTPAHPTGQVWNPTTDFKVTVTVNNVPTPTAPNFIFATLEGTIAARTGNSGTPAGTLALTEVTTPGAVYTGLAIGSNAGANFLYAADFKGGKIDVFDKNYAPVSLPAGSFADADVPAGYAPFNIQALNGHLYVTYALPDPTTHEKIGSGLGYVAEYDFGGGLVSTIAEAGLLDAPWGVDIAPAGFGQYAGDLLVGNFGDGTINVFAPDSNNGATALGSLLDGNGNKITIDGLWGLINGDGGANGDPNSVYFAAGINGEADGLFGRLSVLPEPVSVTLFAAGLAGLAGLRAGRRRKAAVS